MTNIHLCEGEIEILVRYCLVYLVLHKILDSSAEVRIYTIVFLGNGLGQHAVVSLDVPHGNLESVPLWLHQLFSRFQIFRLKLLLTPFSNLILERPCLYLCCSNIHCGV